jgi:hypothetical protein
MDTEISPSSDDSLAVRESEGRRDALVRRLTVGGWSVTGGAVTIFGVATGLDVWRYFQLAGDGMVRWPAVLERVVPFVAVLGFAGLFLAGATTVGALLRREAASLSGIRRRLATLDQLTETSELLEQHVNMLRDEMVELNEQIDSIEGLLTRRRGGEGSRSGSWEGHD